MIIKPFGLIASLFKTGLRQCALPLALLLCQGLPAAVTFTITPSAVSNTYSGQITLTVAGLSSGGTVVVQKFLDLNTNGVINTSDWLVQQFQLTDGQPGMAIGAVTNVNVPGDTDATAGQITVKQNFRGGDFMQNLAGKFLFKVSGNFTPPITNVFTITNFPWAQKFTGNVISNKTSTVVSNAVVLLFPPPLPGDGGPSGSPLAGAVANNAGSYTVQAPAGTYMLAAFQSNYLANFAAAPILTLGSGATVTTNVTVTNTTASISGTNYDAGNFSIRLPGVMVTAQSDNGLMGVAFTDTNGNFTVRVRSGQWSIGADDLSLIVHGYLGLRNDTNVNSGTTGVKIALPKATALIYGTLKDNLGNPFVYHDIYVNDDSGSYLYQTDAYTDTNGNYVAGVLGLGVNDSWWIQANDNNYPTNYDWSQQTISGNIAAGTAVLQNLTAIPGTNHITGNLKDSNGNNLAGVDLFAFAADINGTAYQANATTDDNGNYWLNVANGDWLVGTVCTQGSRSLDNVLGSGNYVCPDSQNVSIGGNNGVVNFTIQVCGGISIVTASPLPVGEVGANYDQFIQASSCGANFNWSQTDGSLPGNLNLNPDGQSYELSGTPAVSGTFTFTVQVADGGSLTANKQFSMTISNALQTATTSLPNGTNGLNYSQQLQATAGVPFGGASPYSWSVVSGSLPANLNLATNGLLSGTLATGGVFDFTVEALDALGATRDQRLSLTIVSMNSNYPPLTAGTGGGQVIIYWPLSWGTNYTVEMTTNLETGTWVPATGGVPAVAFTFTNNVPAAFFRLR